MLGDVKRFITILSFLGVLLMLSGCINSKFPNARPKVAEGEELLCLTETQEEAEKIAELYEIELVSFGNGVAIFHTEKDPLEVIAYGKKNNLPELSLNEVIQLH